jgi:uncharacterized protein DUF4242
MPKYLIERKAVGTARSALRTLKATAAQAGPKLSWVHSYVTGDRCYCVYDAPSEKAVREHFRRSGVPVRRISRVMSIVDPTKL